MLTANLQPSGAGARGVSGAVDRGCLDERLGRRFPARPVLG